MDNLNSLRSEIQTMETIIASQEVACDVARNSLEHRRAAYVVAKSVATANGLPLSAADSERHREDILDGHEILHAKLVALSNMRKELGALEHQLFLAEA